MLRYCFGSMDFDGSSLKPVLGYFLMQAARVLLCSKHVFVCRFERMRKVARRTFRREHIWLPCQVRNDHKKLIRLHSWHYCWPAAYSSTLCNFAVVVLDFGYYAPMSRLPEHKLCQGFYNGLGLSSIRRHPRTSNEESSFDLVCFPRLFRTFGRVYRLLPSYQQDILVTCNPIHFE